MIVREVKFHCQTCNMDLITLDRITIFFKYCINREIRKYRRHVKKGHEVVTTESFVLYEDGMITRINVDDSVSKHILENEIIIP